MQNWQAEPIAVAPPPETIRPSAPTAGATLADGRRPDGQVQRLDARHAPAYAAHLLRLSAEDRRRRFSHPAPDRLVRRSVSAIDWDSTALFGWVKDGVVRGVAHLAWPDVAWLQGGAELAVSVETGFQRQGVGRELVSEAIAEARRRRLSCIHYVGLAENRGMTALMAKLGGTAVREGGEIAGRIDLPTDGDLPGLSRRSRLRRRRTRSGMDAVIEGIDLTPRLP